MALSWFQKSWFWPVLITSVFFGVFLLLGYALYRDYGTYIDEADQIQIGMRNYEFLKRGDPSVLEFRDWDHGVLFEVFTVTARRFLGPSFSSQDIYTFRHLNVYLAFWAGALAFFFLARHRFRSWKMGLLGSAFLFLSPVIFGNAFYNSKDIPFLSFTILALLSQLLFLEKPGLLSAAFHALACALAINVRIPGVIFPAITLGVYLLEWAVPNRREFHPRAGRSLLVLLVFVVLLAGFTLLFFPAAWFDPLPHFIQAFIQLSHRGWVCCNLFFGQMVTADTLPWYYIPAWIGISTPLYYVILFVIGVGASLAAFSARPWLTLTADKHTRLLYLGAFFLPVAAVVVGQSVVYNGWRHMYFIYAPFLMIALEGLAFVLRFLRQRMAPRLAVGVVGLVTLVSFAMTSAAMIRNHPYEFIYFNELLGGDMQAIKQSFELDYWGLSYVQGLRYIAANDPRPRVRIAVNAGHLNHFKNMLPEEDVERLDLTAVPENADYFITDYLWHPQDYAYPNEVYTVRVGNAAILSVFKLR